MTELKSGNSDEAQEQMSGNESRQRPHQITRTEAGSRASLQTGQKGMNMENRSGKK